jgi:hypothetical protein
LFDEQNIPKQSDAGILRIFDPEETTISNWGAVEENKRKTLLKEILEGKFQK